MTVDEFMERFNGADYALVQNRAIRSKRPACACPIEVISGMGVHRVVEGADLLGLGSFDRRDIMDAADFGLRDLKSSAAGRVRQRMLAKIREAHQGKLPKWREASR